MKLSRSAFFWRGEPVALARNLDGTRGGVKC